tara:strand:+ start:3445 stop:3936 length:492 start_codon:yes stop_codon:yes gene_type:complete
MKELIGKIINQSKFEISCFDGKLLLRGRILSPSEANAAGLASGLLAASLANPNQIKEMQGLTEDQDDPHALDRILKIAKTIRPESLVAIGEGQDRILCKVITEASSDNGSTWQRIHLVHGIDQQNADTNRLWVGMIPEEDRSAILEKAMEGHKEALRKIRGSL